MTGTTWVGLGQDRVVSDAKGSERAGRARVRGSKVEKGLEGLTMDIVTTLT